MTKFQAIGFRFAFIALALNVLTWVLPVLSAHANIDFVSICTSQGLEVIKVASADNVDDTDSENSVSQNCSFCNLQKAAFIAPDQKRISAKLQIKARQYVHYENVVLSATDPERDIPARAPPVYS